MKESDKPDTPEFWFGFLMDRFTADLPDNPVINTNPNAPRTRAERLDYLWNYYSGNPPPPVVNEQYKDTFQEVTRKARVNFAEMAVSVMTDRSILTSVFTEQDRDSDGDDQAKRICDASAFEAMHRDLQTYLFTMGEAYAMAIPPDLSDDEGQPRLEAEDDDGPVPILTAEDPRNCIGYSDPLSPGRLRAAVKVYRDDILDRDAAILFWDSKAFRIFREEGADSENFDIEEWEIEGSPTDLSDITPYGGIPVVRFDNKDKMGEFESAIDILDRIMDGILQRIVIAWYQSFRQRAIKGGVDEAEDILDDDPNSFTNLVSNAQDGAIKDLFQADPGALWIVPDGVDFWESGVTDMTGILNAIRDDVKEFAATTRTPMHIITPDAANQTAAGASLMREGLVDKIVDRQARQTPAWRLLFQIALCMIGEQERAKTVELQWAEVERSSLEAQADAANKFQNILSRTMISTRVIGLTPREARRNEEQLMAERMSTEDMWGNTAAGGIGGQQPQEQGQEPVEPDGGLGGEAPSSEPGAVTP